MDQDALYHIWEDEQQKIQAFDPCWSYPMGVKMGDPQVTMGFNT